MRGRSTGPRVGARGMQVALACRGCARHARRMGARAREQRVHGCGMHRRAEVYGAAARMRTFLSCSVLSVLGTTRGAGIASCPMPALSHGAERRQHRVGATRCRPGRRRTLAPAI